MNDSAPERAARPSHIEDWMLDLLDEDRHVDDPGALRLSDGIHWLYHRSLIRPN